MPGQLDVVGALSAWSSLVGGVLLAVGDAIGSGVLDGIGAVLLISGVVMFFSSAVQRSRREDRGLLVSLARSAKDALRLGWYAFKGA